MTHIAIGNALYTVDSVECIINGLASKGHTRLAAIMAAGRYIYPVDHMEDRADIVQTILQIGLDTQDTDTKKACIDALWLLDMDASIKLQLKPLTKMRILSEAEAGEARRKYPYSELV